MSIGGSSKQQRAAGWTVLKRELPRILGTRRRIILAIVMGAFGLGAPLLLQLSADRPLDLVWLLTSLLVAVGCALFGSLGPLVLWLVFDKGRAPRVAIRDETLIEKVADPNDSTSLEFTDKDVLQSSIDARRLILPTSIATQAALAGTGCLLIPAGLLLGVEWYSLIAFPFFTFTGAVTLPGQFAALGRAENVAHAMAEVTDR